MNTLDAFNYSTYHTDIRLGKLNNVNISIERHLNYSQ